MKKKNSDTYGAILVIHKEVRLLKKTVNWKFYFVTPGNADAIIDLC